MDDPGPPALELAGVSKRHGATLALDGLDLRLAPGELVGLLARRVHGLRETLLEAS